MKKKSRRWSSETICDQRKIREKKSRRRSSETIPNNLSTEVGTTRSTHADTHGLPHQRPSTSLNLSKTRRSRLGLSLARADNGAWCQAVRTSMRMSLTPTSVERARMITTPRMLVSLSGQGTCHLTCSLPWLLKQWEHRNLARGTKLQTRLTPGNGYSLGRAKVFHLVPQTVTKGRVVTSEWVFKVKRLSDGSIERYKAWLVARGFSQQPGIECDETVAPVPSSNPSGSPSLLPRCTTSSCRWMCRQRSFMDRSKSRSSWSSQRDLGRANTWSGS